MVQFRYTPPTITIDGYTLEAVGNFICLDSIISSSFYIDSEINNRIAKAATVTAKLTHRNLNNSSLN